MAFPLSQLLNKARVKKPSDVPKQKHWQIIEYDTTTVHHEGDERSRTHPGHGYPAYSETIDSFKQYVFTDKGVWEDTVELICKEKDESKYVFFEVAGVARTSREIKISIDMG